MMREWKHVHKCMNRGLKARMDTIEDTCYDEIGLCIIEVSIILVSLFCEGNRGSPLLLKENKHFHFDVL